MKSITIKNKQTGKPDKIKFAEELEMNDWGLSILVNNELDAYKVAYQYRNVKFGTRVEFAAGVGLWLVTVFNEFAEKAGINK